MAILTISRQYGSGGREVGRAIAKAMDLSLIHISEPTRPY